MFIGVELWILSNHFSLVMISTIVREEIIMDDIAKQFSRRMFTIIFWCILKVIYL